MVCVSHIIQAQYTLLPCNNKKYITLVLHLLNETADVYMSIFIYSKKQRIKIKQGLHSLIDFRDFQFNFCNYLQIIG